MNLIISCTLVEVTDLKLLKQFENKQVLNYMVKPTIVTRTYSLKDKRHAIA